MAINLPPVLFYALGGVLMIFGTIRAVYFGRRRKNSNPTAEADLKTEAEPENQRQASARRRHLFMGIAWIGMGTYLLYSGISLQRRQNEVEAPVAPVPHSAGATVHI